MVRSIRGMGMEVCTTLGMLTPEQAQQLRQAGLTAYNHNLDTSPEFYGQVCGEWGVRVVERVGRGACLRTREQMGRDGGRLSVGDGQGGTWL